MGSDLSQVQAGYDRWSTIYDSDANPLVALEEPVVHAAIGEIRGLSVLDLGCGTGRHAHWLAKQGASVTAIDFSEGMLFEARGKPGAEKIEFLAHDLHQPLPFPTESFDRVVSGLVLEHIREIDSLFREAYRVLRMESKAVFSAMHPAMFLRDARARFTDPVSGEIEQPGSISHSISDFVRAVVRAGFRIEDMVEMAPDQQFATKFKRADKYVEWPMLVVMMLTKSSSR